MQHHDGHFKLVGDAGGAELVGDGVGTKLVGGGDAKLVGGGGGAKLVGDGGGVQLVNGGDIQPGMGIIRGRPPKHLIVPEIVQAMTDIIKLHGFAAQGRRRNETSSMGISIPELRKQLLCAMPALKEIGISSNTVARTYGCSK